MVVQIKTASFTSAAIPLKEHHGSLYRAMVHAAIRTRQVDCLLLFFVGNGVGSELWSRHGFTKL